MSPYYDENVLVRARYSGSSTLDMVYGVAFLYSPYGVFFLHKRWRCISVASERLPTDFQISCLSVVLSFRQLFPCRAVLC